MNNENIYERNRLTFYDCLEKYFLQNDEDSLSITLLCNSLGMQRKTFYNHYNNLSDLYEDYLEYHKQRFNKLIKYQKNYPDFSKKDIIKNNLELLFKYRNTMTVIYKLSKKYMIVDRDITVQNLFLHFYKVDYKNRFINRIAVKAIEETIKLWSLEYNFKNKSKIVDLIYNIGIALE